MKRVILLLSLTLCALALSAESTVALSARQKDLFDQGIYYFNADSDESVGCVVPLEGSAGAEQMWNFLVSTKGLSPIQAAGIMGNIRAESGFNPKRVEDGWGFPAEMDSVPPNAGPQGQPGYGLAQWTSPGRKQGLADRSSSSSLAASDMGLQLNYLWEELTNNYSSTFNKIKQTNDITVVSAVFGHEYEGYGTSTEKLRLKYSREVLAKYGSSGATSSDPSNVITDNPCADNSSGGVQLDPNFKMLTLSTPLSSPGGKITPKGITLHWWGSSSGGRGISALVDALRGNSSCDGGCSVQIGITADGKVYQMTKDLTDLTYHAIGANSTTFGVEIEGGPSDFGEAGITKYPQKFNAVVATVKYLVSKYNLPLDGPVVCNDVSGVHPHKAYNSCPRAQSKEDIDDVYFNAVMQKVRQQ